MTQESGGSMKAEARMNARARTRRTRKRFRVGTVLVAALGVGVLGLGTGGAAADEHDDVTLVVNTKKDLIPYSDPNNPNISSDTESLVAACLKGVAGSEPGNLTVVSGDQLTGHEKGVNDTLRDPDGEGGNPPISGAPQSGNVEPCSLRMALHLAAALAPSSIPVENVSKTSVLIEIAGDVERGSRLLVDAKDLLTAAQVPLPPIVGGVVAIDGCGMVPDNEPSPTSPCVNIEFGGTGVTSVEGVPSGAPGLIALAEDTTITGIAFQGGVGAAIWQPPVMPLKNGIEPGRVTVQNSWFGLKVDGAGNGTAVKNAPSVGIQLSGNGTLADEPSLIGGTSPIERNVFVDDGEGMIGVLVSGGWNNTITGNYFGTDEDGRAVSSVGLDTGVKLTGLGANASRIARTINSAAGQELVGENTANPGLFDISSENRIGDQLETAAASTTACDGACNLFANAKTAAIDVGGEGYSTTSPTTARDRTAVGVRETTIAGNQIGVSAGKNQVGILVQNGSLDTTIGGDSQAESGNVISHSKDAGVAVRGNARTGLANTPDPVFEQAAGLRTEIVKNVGLGNGAGGLIDLGEDKAGNASDGPNGGIQAPVIDSVSPTHVGGSAAPGADIHVYLTSGQGAATDFLRETAADGSGRWSVGVSPGSKQVTATATDVNLGTSELAAPATVPDPPQPKGDDGGGTPPPPPPPPDEEAPKPLLIGGQDASGDKAVVLTPKQVKTLSGQVEDESGVAKVRVALQVLKVRKARLFSGRRGHARRGGRICRYVHLRKGKFLRRPCSRPPYQRTRLREAQSGATAWRLPLGKRVLKRLRVGRYKMLLETTDTEGNVTTHKVPVVIKKRRRGGKAAIQRCRRAVRQADGRAAKRQARERCRRVARRARR